MNKNELAEFLKYSHPKQLYVIDWKKSLLLLICPFQAVVKDNIGVLAKDSIVYIDEVKVTLELTTVFIVEGQAYYYYHFEILTDE